MWAKTYRGPSIQLSNYHQVNYFFVPIRDAIQNFTGELGSDVLQYKLGLTLYRKSTRSIPDHHVTLDGT